MAPVLALARQLLVVLIYICVAEGVEEEEECLTGLIR